MENEEKLNEYSSELDMQEITELFFKLLDILDLEAIKINRKHGDVHFAIRKKEPEL